ncbi:MAG: Xaa-Pro peptidase family protein [Pseudomonadota bacterium]
MLHFTTEEFANRGTQLTEAMAERQLDAMLLFSQESMFWLTGYDTFGFCFFQCLVVKRSGEMALLTRSADLRQAKHTSILDNIIVWKDGGAANPVGDLRNLLTDMDLLGARIGVEYDTSGLNAHYGRMVDEMLTTFAQPTDQSGVIPGLRAVKSDAELKHVKKAAKLSDDALDAALSATKAGADEGKILAAMQGAIFEGGGDYPGNEFILGSGEDALLCRYKSGRRKLSKTDQLTLEWSGAFAHYHAPMMATVVVAKERPEHAAYFEAAHDALSDVEAAMVAGNTFGDVFDAHARAMDQHGLSRHRLNACGYSVGAVFAPCWMDKPMFYAGNESLIVPNMTLFAHMIIMDSDSGTAMTLGQTYITGEKRAKGLSRHEMVMLRV